MLEIVEVVQTEIGVPAASVKTLGGAGGGAGADEVGEEGFRPGARPPVGVVPELDPPPDDTEVPPDELMLAAFPAASVGEGTTLGSTVGVGEALAKLGDSADFDVQPVWTKTIEKLSKAANRIFLLSEAINSPFDKQVAGIKPTGHY